MTQRPSWRWLVPPALLIAANLVAVLTTSGTSTRNGIYSGSVLAGALASTLVLGGYAVLAARVSTGDARATLALRRPTAGSHSARLVLAGVVAITIVSLALEPILHGDRRQGLTPTHQPHGGDWLLLAAGLVVLVGIVPLCEELLFRGLIFAALGRYAVAGSAVFFALAHAIPAVLIQVFVAGLVLGEIRRRTDSLWPGVAAHATVNLIGIAAALATAGR